jgi:hypothetical protein
MVASDYIESIQPGVKPLKQRMLNEIESTTFLFSIRWIIFGRFGVFSNPPFIVLEIEAGWPGKTYSLFFQLDAELGMENGNWTRKLENRTCRRDLPSVRRPIGRGLKGASEALPQ